jgi:peptidyl-prolyl cis-trans isomerase SurA
MAAQLGASVVTNDQVKARDLPARFRIPCSSCRSAKPPPVRLDRGRRARADAVRPRRSQGSDGPSFEEMQSQMEDDRVNKRAQSYLRDLRRDAVIEYN